MELSKLQQEILENSTGKSVIISSAASGKTRLLTEKVRQLLRAGINPREIAVITFTNMAAAELRQRLGDDYKDGLFIGTIHSLANYFLLSSGIKTDSIIEDEKFDELFELVEKNPYCVKHLQWVLLDEAQDSDDLQFKFLFKMINPDFFFVCGDPKQSIYRWRGCDPELMNILAGYDNTKTFEMNENYRNGANILNFAKRIIYETGMKDNSISMRDYSGKVISGEYNLPEIISTLKNSNSFNDWAILVRTNSEINKISNDLLKNNIPCDTFKQGDLTKAELCEKLNQNTVKVLTVHSAKGLEWNNIIVIGLRLYGLEDRCIGYVAATRAKNQLYWLHYAKSAAKQKLAKW